MVMDSFVLTVLGDNVMLKIFVMAGHSPVYPLSEVFNFWKEKTNSLVVQLVNNIGG